MSQAGIIDIENAHPQIPTSFITNMGTAIPISNILNIGGTTVAAHGTPIYTTGSGNSVTIVAQYASASPFSSLNTPGFASFNSTDFTVDANGFVTLLPGSSVGSFYVDASSPPGTFPVYPNSAGAVGVTGGQVAAGTTTNVIRTDSLNANFYTIQIQRSQAVASSTIGDNGVSHFNSAYFTVDANGFVSLSSSGSVISLTGTANEVLVNGTSGTATKGAITLTTPQPIATTSSPTFYDLTLTDNLNLAAATNGTTGVVNVIVPDSAPYPYLAIYPNDNNIFFGQYAGPTSYTAGETVTCFCFGDYSMQSLVAAGDLIGIGAATLVSATNAQSCIAIGNGALIDATTTNGCVAIGTDSLANILTGENITAIGESAGYNYNSSESNNIIIGSNVSGTVGENNVLRIGYGTGTGTFEINAAYISGIYGISQGGTQQMVTINSSNQLGTANLPFNSINIQKFTTSGTYTPTSGMLYCIIEVVGGGGGGGGAASTSVSQAASAGGGGSGGYARAVASAATIGASQTVTIGAGGTAGANTGGIGGTGGTTSVGTLCIATGGTGGDGASAQTISFNNPGAGGSGTTGNLQLTGNTGGTGFGLGVLGVSYNGSGGNSYFGGGIGTSITTTTEAGYAGSTGSGGSGGANGSSQGSGVSGGAGGAGYVVITEYI